METEAVGQRLREFRGLAGKTQAALAYESGVSISTLIRYEKGDPGMKLLPLAALADTLGVRMQDFWDGASLRERDSNSQPTGLQFLPIPEDPSYLDDSSPSVVLPMPIEAA